MSIGCELAQALWELLHQPPAMMTDSAMKNRAIEGKKKAKSLLSSPSSAEQGVVVKGRQGRELVVLLQSRDALLGPGDKL